MRDLEWTKQVFGFESGKYDNRMLNAFPNPILVNEKGIEPNINKEGQSIRFILFGIVQLLDFLRMLGGATILCSFRDAYTMSDRKELFAFEKIYHPEKSQRSFPFTYF